ncbi:putative aminopeptidase [Burkholderiales bacterium JOSHI_001]|nr:putative aminopeptidase [Burkholderiales bacterium JOSHI_001]
MRKRTLLMAGAGSLLAAGVVALLLGGCSSLGYYGQSVGGHLDLMQRAKPVPQWLADDSTPADLKARLALTQRMRDFAVRELHLPDNNSYRSYAALDRPAVVWNVVAAPELSLTLKTWCFPVMGCVGYRGYFKKEPAEALAAELRAQGLEASVYGVPAYSTLGWSNWMGGDPLLSTFIQWPEGELGRLIFHELSHQVAYAADDTMFNESYATAVERIGGALWLATQADAAARDDYARYDGRRQDFRALVGRYRDELAALYASAQSDGAKRSAKAELFQRLQADHARLKAERWGGFSGYDAWFERANNATLGAFAAYNELVLPFERLFDQQGRDWARFHTEVKRLAALPKAERRAALGSP